MLTPWIQRSGLAALTALAFLLTCDEGVLLASSDGQAVRVELRCKITALDSDPGIRQWRIQIQKPTGEPVSVTTALTGSTVSFKNLESGIYVVCLTGQRERRRCRSLDLVPPKGHESYLFTEELEAPDVPLNRQDLHRVSSVDLAVPRKAREEMIRSEEAQLQGDIAQSIHHLKRAIKIYPSYSDALNNLGTYHLRTGHYDLALRCFQKVTELSPDFYGGWVNMGGSLLMAGRFDEALEANNSALLLRPDDAVVNSQVALNYYYLHRYSEAETYFKRVLALDPSSANSPQLFLAHIASVRGRQEESAEYLRSFLLLHPNSPEAPGLRQRLNNLTDSVGQHKVRPLPERR